MTQLEQAQAGRVTPEIEAVVARGERLEPELVRDEVARGRMVIPANKAHLAKGLEPIGIGIAARTKINANIGKSAVSSDSAVRVGEAVVGRPLRGRHGDGPFDRRADRRRPRPDHRGRHGAGRHGADLPGGRSNSTTSSTCGRRIFWTWSSSRPGRASIT